MKNRNFTAQKREHAMLSFLLFAIKGRPEKCVHGARCSHKRRRAGVYSRRVCSRQIGDAGGETPPLRDNAYAVRGVCTKSRIRGVAVSRPSKASVGVLGKAEDNAPYGIVGCVHHAHVFKCIAEAGGVTRDHRRCVNALATGEGNCPTVFVRTPRTVSKKTVNNAPTCDKKRLTRP